MAEMIDNNASFELWLKNKLIELKTDDEIFSPYIKGILDSDDSIEEKQDGIKDILAEIIEESQILEKVCAEILNEWTLYINSELAKASQQTSEINIDEKLVTLLQQTKVSAPTTNPLPTPITSEQKKLKEAILAQYADVSSGEESEDEEEGTGDAGFMKNSNVDAVIKAEKEKKDKDKEESQKRKEKDKEDRAKQKTKDEDRKEKEKKRTQKGEKRR